MQGWTSSSSLPGLSWSSCRNVEHLMKQPRLLTFIVMPLLMTFLACRCCTAFQVSNDWPMAQYHLSSSMASAHAAAYTTEVCAFMHALLQVHGTLYCAACSYCRSVCAKACTSTHASSVACRCLNHVAVAAAVEQALTSRMPLPGWPQSCST